MAAKPAVLRYKGKPFTTDRPTPSVSKLLTLLRSLPDDEVFDTDQMREKSGVRSIGDLGKHKELAPHSLKVGPTRYWGAARAIAALREQVSQ